MHYRAVPCNMATISFSFLNRKSPYSIVLLKFDSTRLTNSSIPLSLIHRINPRHSPFHSLSAKKPSSHGKVSHCQHPSIPFSVQHSRWKQSFGPPPFLHSSHPFSVALHRPQISPQYATVSINSLSAICSSLFGIFLNAIVVLSGDFVNSPEKDRAEPPPHAECCYDFVDV